MKVTVFGELVLLIGIAALAWFMYLQQAQLLELELELDRMRGAVGAVFPPVPAADADGASAAVEVERAKPRRKASGA